MKIQKTKTATQILPSNTATKAKSWTMLNGDSEQVLKNFPENHFDSVVCDPPYGLSSDTMDGQHVARVIQSWMTNDNLETKGRGFAGAEWDAFVPPPSLWKEVFRVVKPGAYVAAFSSSRTDDLLKLSLRLAGFEITDTVAYILRGGFPKYVDLGRAVEKRLRQWGHTPPEAHNDTTAIRTDLSGQSFLQSLQRKKTHGRSEQTVVEPSHDLSKRWADYHSNLKSAFQPIILARKPAWSSTIDNLIVHGVGALNIGGCRIPRADNDDAEEGLDSVELGRYPANVIGELGEDNSKFFFNPHNAISKRPNAADKDLYMPEGIKNDHPTPKPVSLMEWLTRLITPPNGLVLDPFAGSGSSGIAALHEECCFVGIELDPRYHELASSRLRNCENTKSAA